MSEHLDNRPRTEAEVRKMMHEPEPEQQPPAARATCPCGYSEVVSPIWRPYLKASGWVLAWYYGVKCPKHGWASRLKSVQKRPSFNFVPDPSSDDIL